MKIQKKKKKKGNFLFMDSLNLLLSYHSSNIHFINTRILKKIKRNDDYIFIFNRSSVILPFMSKKSFYIHTGNNFSKLNVKDDRYYYYRFGSFGFTRKIFYDQKAKKIKKNFKK